MSQAANIRVWKTNRRRPLLGRNSSLSQQHEKWYTSVGFSRTNQERGVTINGRDKLKPEIQGKHQEKLSRGAVCCMTMPVPRRLLTLFWYPSSFSLWGVRTSHHTALTFPRRTIIFSDPSKMLSEAVVLPTTISWKRRCIREGPAGLKYFVLKTYKSLCNARPSVLKITGTTLPWKFYTVVLLTLITTVRILFDLPIYVITLDFLCAIRLTNQQRQENRTCTIRLNFMSIYAHNFKTSSCVHGFKAGDSKVGFFGHQKVKSLCTFMVRKS